MATAQIIIHQRTDQFVVVQTLTNLEVAVGDTITVSNTGHGMDGTHTIYALPQYLFVGVDEEGDLQFDYTQIIPNQVLYHDEGSDQLRGPAATNALLTFTPTCTWITSTMIQDWIGIPTVSVDDAAFLTKCANAANAVAYRKRSEAGYRDSLSTVPGGDVLLGTIELGAGYFRARGAVDMLAQFGDTTTPTPPQGLTPSIMQKLGIPRPAVA